MTRIRCSTLVGAKGYEVARRPRTNFGQRPLGWEKIGFDVPEALADEIHRVRGTMPIPSNKIMGTAAMALFVALPKQVQEALFGWAHGYEIRPDKIDASEAVRILLPLLIMLGKVLPPTENPPDGEPAGGPKRPPRRTVPVPDNPNVLRTIYPATMRNGYSEQMIVDYEMNTDDKGDEITRKKAEGGR